VSARAVPFHCPYCGDQDLRPFEDGQGGSTHGEWQCRSCLRAFSLKLLGLVRPQTAPGVGR
jgi:transposase-like protein